MKRYIRSSAEIAYMVTYGWDEGGPESGPIWGSDRWLIYARSEEEACRKFEDEIAGNISGYEGCWAEPATPEDIAEWEAGENWEEELPFSSTRTKKRAIKASEDKDKYKFTFEISQIWYEDGDVVDKDIWQESASATAENPLNARIKIENRLEKKYGSKNDEWELVIKVIEGPDGYKDSTKYSSREGYVESSSC